MTLLILLMIATSQSFRSKVYVFMYLYKTLNLVQPQNYEFLNFSYEKNGIKLTGLHVCVLGALSNSNDKLTNCAIYNYIQDVNANNPYFVMYL